MLGYWNHLVVTWQSRDGEVLIYLNSQRVHQAVEARGETFHGGGTLVLGQVNLKNLRGYHKNLSLFQLQNASDIHFALRLGRNWSSYVTIAICSST